MEVYNPFSWENQHSYQQTLVNYVNSKVEEQQENLSNPSSSHEESTSVQSPPGTTADSSQESKEKNSMNNRLFYCFVDYLNTLQVSLFILKRDYEQCIDLLGSPWMLYDTYDDCYCLARQTGIDGYDCFSSWLLFVDILVEPSLLLHLMKSLKHYWILISTR